MMLTRREFVNQTILGCAGMGLSSCASNGLLSGRQSPKPNLVFILCDDLGYGDLRCYGHPVIQTPCLDRLASEGIQLTDCYASQPVCSPSRAGVLTGRTPYRCRIPDWIPENSPIHLQRSEMTIARLLRSTGYRTIHCGKWHLNGGMETGQPTPGDHGFEHWFSTQNNALPSHRDPVNFFRNGEKTGTLEGYSSSIVVDEAIRELSRVGDRPFALFVWFHSPHEPIATSEEFMNAYSDEPDETRRMYYGNVSQMDYECGRLLKYLDDRGWRDNTFVLFTSDNGPETLNRYKGSHRSHGSPGPLRGMKLHMYEGGIRVPGIIRYPIRATAGQICNEPVNGTDILPTFCDLAKIDIPRDRAIDGASLTPIFHGRSIHRSRPLYWRYDRAISQPKLALREGEWKLLSTLDCSRVELYNLRGDRGETTDLSGREPGRTRKMIATLMAIHHEVIDDPISILIADPRDQK